MQRWRWFVAGKEIAGKKYVVKLTIEERERLDALIRAGKSSAQLLTRARILLKADVSEGGEGWSDSAISAALDTSINTVSRTRQQLVEEGFEATLKRKYNPNSARPRIFDGAAEAKLIALTRNGIEGEPRDARPWRRKVYPVHADPPRRRGRAGGDHPTRSLPEGRRQP